MVSEAKSKVAKWKEKAQVQEEYKTMNLTDFILKHSSVLNLKLIPTIIENLRSIRKKKEDKILNKKDLTHMRNESGSSSKNKNRKVLKFDLKDNNPKHNEQKETNKEYFFKLMKDKALKVHSSSNQNQFISKKKKITNYQKALKVN